MKIRRCAADRHSNAFRAKRADNPLKSLIVMLVNRRWNSMEGTYESLTIFFQCVFCRTFQRVRGHRLPKVVIVQKTLNPVDDGCPFANRHDESIDLIAYNAASVGSGNYGQTIGERLVAHSCRALAKCRKQK